MTIWGAYFNFEEHEKGSLEIGKSADFVVLNQNIMEVEADLIPNTEVLQTYIDGELVYSKQLINPNKKFLPGMGTKLVSEYAWSNTLFKEKNT